VFFLKPWFQSKIKTCETARSRPASLLLKRLYRWAVVTITIGHPTGADSDHLDRAIVRVSGTPQAQLLHPPPRKRRRQHTA
jgi:hypothetical protein